MAAIRIKRPNRLKDSSRVYQIFIDGQQVGTISNDETKVFPTTVGQHIVWAKIDYLGSPDITIDVKENQTKDLKVSGPKFGWIDSISLAIIALHFILAKFAHFEYAIFLLSPILITILYDHTKGRKKYLLLEELDDN